MAFARSLSENREAAPPSAHDAIFGPSRKRQPLPSLLAIHRTHEHRAQESTSLSPPQTDHRRFLSPFGFVLSPRRSVEARFRERASPPAPNSISPSFAFLSRTARRTMAASISQADIDQVINVSRSSRRNTKEGEKVELRSRSYWTASSPGN